MSKTEFSWEKFEAELEKSTALCSTGKQDIKRAIAAGKGLAIAERPAQIKPGQLWKREDGLYLATRTMDREFFTSLPDCHWLNHGNWEKCVKYGSLTFVAESLPVYLEKNGGKL